MVDSRLPFGAVCFMMAAKYTMRKIIAYIGDFLIVCQSRGRTLETLNALISVLRKLGFRIIHNKVVNPTTRLTFLGLILDSLQMTIKLPRDKVDDLKTALMSSLNKQKWTKQYIQHITGKLSLEEEALAPIRLAAAMEADITWWLDYIYTFSGIARLADNCQQL